jgi:hypothetical protein
MTANKNAEETQELDIQIQRGIFDRKQRQLLITPEFIQFENKSGDEPFTTFKKEEIVEYLYGINWIRGFEFTVGREYVIYVKNSSNEELKINFKSFYGAKKKELYGNYVLIQERLWDFYFGRVGGTQLNQFNQGNNVTIGRATLTNEGVVVSDGGLVKNDKLILWDDVTTKEYYTYVAVYSSKDAAKLNATFSFLKDWNTMVLFSVIQRILKDKAPAQ